MKAIFIGQSQADFEEVYGQSEKQVILDNFEIEDKLYAMEDLTPNMDTECLFSTWGMPVFTEEEIDLYFPKLKIVFYGAGSVRRFAFPFLNKGIKVISAWLANAVPVAEFVVSQIILANKGFFTAARKCYKAECRKEAHTYAKTFPGTYSTNVGIIGTGAIGALVCQMLKNYNVNVLAYSPHLTDEKAERLGVTKASIPEIFENCQTISNHIANIPETVGMFNYELFSKMKPNATFINTGRGAQVVEEDLLRALAEAPDRSAVLDVTLFESTPEKCPLFQVDNVFITPHIAGSWGQECRRMALYVGQEALRYLAGEPLQYEVTLKMMETMA